MESEGRWDVLLRWGFVVVLKLGLELVALFELLDGFSCLERDFWVNKLVASDIGVNLQIN